MSRPRDWNPSTIADFAELFCGDLIGSGVARYVYAFALDASKVIKVEMPAQSFQNVIEWETWNNLKDSPYAKYLAPCHWISPCGITLVMSRVAPLDKKHERVLLPSFLSDFKRDNYGLLKGRVVACDYGSNLLLNNGAFGSKMQRPEWWGDEPAGVVFE